MKLHKLYFGRESNRRPKTQPIQRPSTKFYWHWTNRFPKIILKSKDQNSHWKKLYFFPVPIAVPLKKKSRLHRGLQGFCSTFRSMCYWSVWLLLPSSAYWSLCKAADMKTTSLLKSFPSNQRRPQRKTRLIALEPPQVSRINSLRSSCPLPHSARSERWSNSSRRTQIGHRTPGLHSARTVPWAGVTSTMNQLLINWIHSINCN